MGALATAPAAGGRLDLQMNPMYKPGEQGPAPGGGKVSASLSAGGFTLDSIAMEWLVVTPDSKVAVKGTATLNGEDGYGFVAYGYDDDPDALRLVVWSLSEGPYPQANTVYDNRRDGHYDLDLAQPQPLAGGSVQAHI
ncbi:hypothetical protein [Nonomuraea sp. CA-141351]|uniref:hypothetical protein n=1 Tax=Nonomuraea sp. CA-141351 TaxID=3239996 RepID=UPI003D8C7ACC